jgi:hypothetical protein
MNIFKAYYITSKLVTVLSVYALIVFNIIFTRGIFGIFQTFIKPCFFCHPTESSVLEEVWIEPRTVATLALEVKRFSHSARSHPTFVDAYLLTKLKVNILVACIFYKFVFLIMKFISVMIFRDPTGVIFTLKDERL